MTKPIKLCACGCGLSTPIATHTDTKHGRVKGQPTRFRNGHHSPPVVRQGGYIKDNVGYIPLTNNMWALVDADWWHYLSQWNWCAQLSNNGRWYAVRNGGICMHRIVLGVTDPNIEVDHIDRENTLDNRRENLRPATHPQNKWNTGLIKTNSSGLIGVSWQTFRSGNGKWKVQIRHNGQRIHLGLFADKIDAALAYDAAALKYHGEFAVLNFPPKKPAAREATQERKSA
jgi:hypothetical protein